ncbi:metallophosphoesterase family protein [Geobacter sp. DSM 9736]|uniref:metallophosphoesterase family protein n=1 Tax=Geobacter sp. DSM 9736 TaxID=1277350 RepID=UPI000B50DDE4|nr:metallophosphoesterase family protein [Geobacter sp. DSM 9736]SNB46434.1 serine/threonine protein phosphatase 1 [Geobacter sp. DSM 9736]
MTPRRFVIPDVHGCALTLERLLDRHLQLQKQDRLYFLGDLINRGARSREVLELIFDLIRRSFIVYCIRGNHEQMLLDACDTIEAFPLWLINGGYATLDSFNAHAPGDIPDRYLYFIASFPYYIELNDFILVHGSLNLDIPDPFTDTAAMLWGRNTPINLSRLTNRRIICGHTPYPVPVIKDSLKAEIITLDNGCVLRENSSLGGLTGLELNSMDLVLQENVD